jgi:hypothetical protein
MGSVALSATNSLYALSYLGSSWAGTKALRDIIIYDSVVSQSDYEQLQAYLL